MKMAGVQPPMTVPGLPSIRGEKNNNYCYLKLPSEGNKDVLASLLRDAPMMLSFKCNLFYTSAKAKKCGANQNPA